MDIKKDLDEYVEKNWRDFSKFLGIEEISGSLNVMNTGEHNSSYLVQLLYDDKSINFYATPLDEKKNKHSFIRRKALAETGVSMPRIISSDDSWVFEEEIRGETLKSFLGDFSDYDTEQSKSIYRTIGKEIGLIHSQNNYHGDPNTENIIVDNGQIGIIDPDYSNERDMEKLQNSDINQLLQSTLMDSLDYDIMQDEVNRVVNPKLINDFNDLVEEFFSGYSTAVGEDLSRERENNFDEHIRKSLSDPQEKTVPYFLELYGLDRKYLSN